MKRFICTRSLLMGVFALSSTSIAFASTGITPYFETAGTQSIGVTGKLHLCGSSPICNIGVENFDGLTTGALASHVATFPGQSSITGTFSGTGVINDADQYGGAGGTGRYLAVSDGHSETLLLNQQVNFFGLWFSALDSTNSLSFYNTAISTSNPLLTFNALSFSTLVGACHSNPFCGNPNSDFLGDNGAQQYAFLDFVATGVTFNQIVISEGNSGSFEADNETVGNISNPNPTGTSLTPEPSGLAIVGAGLLLCCVGRRRFA